MKDTISEMTYGAGAVKLDGKWIFRDMGVDTFKGRRVRVTVMAVYFWPIQPTGVDS
jgi:hypothetical protein